MIDREKRAELLFNGAIALLLPLVESKLMTEESYAKTLEFAFDMAKNILSMSEENPYAECR